MTSKIIISLHMSTSQPVSYCCIILSTEDLIHLNFMVLQYVKCYQLLRRSAQDIWILVSRLSRSLKVIETNTNWSII